jgi:predicted acetyltransferase
MEYDFQRRYEQQMEPIAILLASIAAIYQRYGYAVVSSRQRYRIDPKAIAFAPTAPRAEGAWREASRRLPMLKQIYRSSRRPGTWYIHRRPDGRAGDGRGPAGSRWHRAQPARRVRGGGQPQGYVSYAAKSFESHPDGAGPGQRVFVRDSAWLTPSAYRAIWDHLRTFDLAVRVQMFAPNDDPAFDLMLDPRELNATRFDWILGRIIDVERALPLRPTAARIRASTDGWNRDRWAPGGGGGRAP